MFNWLFSEDFLELNCNGKTVQMFIPYVVCVVVLKQNLNIYQNQVGYLLKGRKYSEYTKEIIKIS